MAEQQAHAHPNGDADDGDDMLSPMTPNPSAVRSASTVFMDITIRVEFSLVKAVVGAFFVWPNEDFPKVSSPIELGTELIWIALAIHVHLQPVHAASMLVPMCGLDSGSMYMGNGIYRTAFPRGA